MRHGTQGHLAEPRRPTRALAWHGGDTCAIFTYIHIIYGYSAYKRSIYRNSLTVICAPFYIPDCFLSFCPCGTMFPSFLLISGHVELREALDASASTKARRCGGREVHWITNHAGVLIVF